MKGSAWGGASRSKRVASRHREDGDDEDPPTPDAAEDAARRGEEQEKVKVSEGREYAAVRWVEQDRGFAFADDSKGREVFIHAAHCEGGVFEALRPGDTVSYILLTSEKGLKGTMVRREEPAGGMGGLGGSEEGQDELGGADGEEPKE